MRSLAITVRFLDGRYHGAGDWPPDPARLFQALVAGAANGLRLPAPARDALEWLERLDPPVIAAPPARRAQAVRRWVPNNDTDATLATAAGGYAGAVAAVRTAKAEHPWLFDAETPLVYLWKIGAQEMPPALPAIVEALFRLGRGTDPAYATLEILSEEQAEDLLLRFRGAIHRPGPGSDRAVPCDGTLASLARRHTAFSARFCRQTRGLAFRQPPKPRLRLVPYDAPLHRLVYHLCCTALELAGRFKPIPVTQAEALTDLILSQAAHRLRHALPAQADIIDRQVLGKAASAADLPARLRVLPLPPCGHQEVDPSIRRILVEIPAASHLLPADIDWVFATLAPQKGDFGGDWRL